MNPYSQLAEECKKAGIGQQLAAIFKRRWGGDDLQAQVRQVRAAYVNQNVGRRLMGNGIGQVKMSVDAKFYWDMVALYGPDCWKDKAFRNSVLSKNPECRVRSYSDKLTVPVQQKVGDKQNKQIEISDSTIVGKRFRKTYKETAL